MPPNRQRPAARAESASPRVTETSAAPAATGSGRQALGLGLVFVVSLGVIFWALWQLLAETPTRSSLPIPTRAPLTIPANATQFNSLEEFERGVRDRPNSPFVLVVRAAELTARVAAESGRDGSAPMKISQTEIQDGRVILIGQLRLPGGLDAPARVAIEPRARSGRVVYDIPEIDFGPFPAPGPARDRIADAIDRALAQLRIADLMFVEGLEARGGAITLVGRMK